MDRRKLKTLIDKKRDRNLHLITQIKYLELVKNELYKINFKRFFNTTYLVIKRNLLIFISVPLIFFGVFTLINTNWVLKNTKLNEFLINYQYTELKEILDNDLNIIYSKKKLDNFINYNVHSTTIQLSILSIIIGLFLLYISRLTYKIRLRNKKLFETETKMAKILYEFKEIVNSEEDELKDLEDIYHHKIVGTKSSPSK